jgi:hypothetical protein
MKDDLEFLRAEYAFLEECDRQQDDEFVRNAARISQRWGIEIGRVLLAIAADPERVSGSRRLVDVGEFAANPEQVANACLLAYVVGVRDTKAVAGKLTTAAANKAATATKKAKAAPLHARILRLAASVDKGLSERSRAKIIHNRMGATAVSVETIRKVLRAAQK